MITPLGLSAAEFAAYLAAIEAHPYASLLLTLIAVALARAQWRAPRQRPDSGQGPDANGDRPAGVTKPPSACPPAAWFDP